LKPSARGELEITDVNREYLHGARCTSRVMGRGMAWLDTGTHESLLEAARTSPPSSAAGSQGPCPEEIAYRLGYIDAQALESLGQSMAKNAYGQYLLALLRARGALGDESNTFGAARRPDRRAPRFGDERGFSSRATTAARSPTPGSMPNSCRTTTLGRAEACCAGCTIRSSARRGSWCA
jgi:hypothetical protein